MTRWSTSRERASRSCRRLLAITAAALPVAVAAGITCAWWGRLPARIATTFGPDGRPTGHETPLVAAILHGALLTLFLAASVGSAFARDRRKARTGCAVTAGFVAMLAAGWVLLVGLGASTLSQAAWWLIVAAPAWAGVPYWVFGAAGGREDLTTRASAS